MAKVAELDPAERAATPRSVIRKIVDLNCAVLAICTGDQVCNGEASEP